MAHPDFHMGHMANKSIIISSLSKEETTSFRRSGCANMGLEEEKVMKSKGGDEEVVLAKINKEEREVNHVKHEENGKKRPSSTLNNLASSNHEDQLRSTKAKIGEVREENEKLKDLLSKIVKDYQSLQKHFNEVVQEKEAKKSTKIHQQNKEPELVSLSLGRSSSSEPKRPEEKKSSSNYSSDGNADDHELKINKGLSLGLDCKFEPDSSVTMQKNNNNNANSENSFDEEPKEEVEPTETWSPSKVLKTAISADDEVLQQNQIKKTRVSVRARCDTPTMNDGCQWRKYGQKIAKGNPCPRAYYRCTVSPTCPVRKQVQRCAEDMSILITTYEGNHNHPLSLSATAMASTTAAAASMLQSRSSTSHSGLGTSSISAPASISTSNGLNFTLSQNSRPQQFYFPNSSISTCNSHPTITLDLTAPSGATSQLFNRFSSSGTRCLNFSSSSLSSTSLDHSNIRALQSLSNPSGYTTYETLLLNRNCQEKQSNQDYPHFYQPYMQMLNTQITTTSSPHNQQSLTADSIAAATKVITSNPTFRSALAAAITSFVGNNVGSSTNNHGAGEHYSGLNLKLGDRQSPAFNMLYSSNHSSNGVGCASSYLNKSATSLSSQQEGSLVLFPSAMPLSSSKSSSGSPANSRDHNNG